MTDALLDMRGIRKSFNHIEVLRSVNFAARAGEVHALVGQNGAGKSSLMKVLAGVYSSDAGAIVIDGVARTFRSAADAHAAGVRMVFQEFSLVPQLSVAANVVLDNEPTRGVLVDDRAARRRTAQIFERLGVPIDPRAEVGTLRVGDRQMVEIAKALASDPGILVLDEPTASLSRPEVERLFEVIRRLRGLGLAIVFISHHMQEIEELCDRVSVLRDGAKVAELSGDAIAVASVIDAMLPPHQRPSQIAEPRSARAAGPDVLQVNRIRSGRVVRDVSFTLGRGEVVGLAGLLGSGTGEVLDVLFGLRAIDRGTIALGGRPYLPLNAADAVGAGVVLISEDRRTSGIVSGHTVGDNMLQMVWNRFSRAGWIQARKADDVVYRMIDRLRIKTTGSRQQIDNLSGGNQQKVLVGRALLAQPRVLLLSEPTAGIDVGARADIATIVRNFSADGGTALWVSSDMQELAGACDRVLVMRHGEIVQEYSAPDEATLVAAIQTATADHT